MVYSPYLLLLTAAAYSYTRKRENRIHGQWLKYQNHLAQINVSVCSDSEVFTPQDDTFKLRNGKIEGQAEVS